MFAVPSFFGYNTTFVSTPVATAATGVGETSFTANWNAFSGASYYLLDVSTSSSFSSFVLQDQTVIAPTTSYLVSGLTASTTYYYRLRAVTGVDADYLAVLTYATTQGYTLPSVGQRIKQNQLVVDLKSAGVWSKLDTFAVFATDGDSNFALIDWKRLSQYTAVNSPTFTINEGFTGNGTSSYINTNYNPNTNAVNLSLNSTSMGGYKFARNHPGSFFRCEIGSLVTIPSASGLHFNANNGIRVNSSINMSEKVINSGVFSLIRNNATEFKLYKDSSKTASDTQLAVSTSIPSLDLFALSRNVNGTASQFSQDTFSIIYLAADITSEYSDFVDALDNYINAL